MTKQAIYREIGLRHQAAGGCCEDSVCQAVSADGRYAAIALSDGIGACRFAKEAADTAVTAANFIVEHFEDLENTTDAKIASALSSYVIRAIRKTAADLGQDISHFGCTFLAAAMDLQTGHSFTFHIGDGSIFALKANAQTERVSWYKHEYVNVVDSATDENVSWKITRSEDTAAYLLTSDGAEPFLITMDDLPLRKTAFRMLYFQFNPEARIEDEFRTMIRQFQTPASATADRMTDDVSFAYMANLRMSGAVSEKIPPELLENLLPCPPEFLPYVNCGMTKKQFRRAVHNKYVYNKYIRPLIDAGYLHLDKTGKIGF